MNTKQIKIFLQKLEVEVPPRLNSYHQIRLDGGELVVNLNTPEITMLPQRLLKLDSNQSLDEIVEEATHLYVNNKLK